MPYNFRVEKHTLKFLKPAKTSRGEYSEKNSWLICIEENGYTGVGEASPLPDLSPDMQSDRFSEDSDLGEIYMGMLDSEEFWLELGSYPALYFAHECAMLDLKMKKNGILFDTDFTSFKSGIPINGLVWMDSATEMYENALQKIRAGFHCIKFKIGALDHDEECKLIEKIRKQFSAFKLEIRLDANGAFLSDEALERIADFSEFDVHSIEQPVKAGQIDIMAEICAKSPVKIALDEELIYAGERESEFELLLKKINPHFLVLKPTLLGGFSNCDIWISKAEKFGIDWWATSALEGNIGLSHIAQWVSGKKNNLHQGLGTGTLFENNFPARTEIRGEFLCFKN